MDESNKKLTMDIKPLLERIQKLEERLNALGNSATIPIEVDGALRDRLGVVLSGISTVTVGSKTQAVNEGGVATYNVAKPMTAIIQVKIGGNIYNFADYT